MAGQVESYSELIDCGYNSNRKIDQLIEQAGLAVTQMKQFQMQSVPGLGGEMYRGKATKPG